jgi:hypothetical protein
VLSLPIEAVFKEGASSLVTCVVTLPSGSQAREKVEIQVGARNDRELEVVSGLNAADRILIEPPSAAQNETQL